MTVAAIQMSSTDNFESNCNVAKNLIYTASDLGAKLICLPEVFSHRAPSANLTRIETLSGPTINFLQKHASQTKTWIIGGSFACSINKATYNVCPVINPSGELIATYKKMHLFSSLVKDASVDETQIYTSGDAPSMVEINGIKIGLSICYDLRFPELYRYYFKHGAQIMIVASAFTYTTGKAHWKPLLTARAIENQCMIIAPNQFGSSPNSITSYGHSCIIDNWGTTLANAKNQEACIISTFSASAQLDNRIKLPTHHHLKSIEP
jgi:nitrilase